MCVRESVRERKSEAVAQESGVRGRARGRASGVVECGEGESANEVCVNEGVLLKTSTLSLKWGGGSYLDP